MLYSPAQLQVLDAIIETPKFLVHPYIPAKSKVILLHGPGGVGKSAFIWSLANALENGQSFLDISLQPSRTLVLSTDMSIHEMNLRWTTKFKAYFHAEVCSPFDILDKGFRKTEVFERLEKFTRINQVELVLIDTLGKIHFNDPSDPATVSRVYQALTTWFPDTTILVNAHNRKSQHDQTGAEIITDDDFLCSRKWADDAVGVLQIRRVNGSEFKSRLYHTKSQVSIKADPIDLYIDIYGQVETWDDGRANEVINRWKSIMDKADPIKAYMYQFECSRPTAYRVKKMWETRHQIASKS